LSLRISRMSGKTSRSTSLLVSARTGKMRPDPETVEEFRRVGIQVEALPTADAVRRYKELDPHRRAAALHHWGHISKGC
jgi:hypothetical protein